VASRPIDLVLLGARVFGYPGGEANAVAVRGDRIAAVGTEPEVRSIAGPRADLLDLRGRMIVPGFQDAHVHPADSGRDRLLCDLSGSEDPSEYLDIVAGYAHGHPEAQWILGSGWAMSAFPRGIPRREDLDAVVSDRPVFLPSRDGHSAWVNSRALELAAVTASTADPEDGRIERDPRTGEPLGTLQEGAMRLVEDLVPEPSSDEWEAGILEGQRYLHSLGITAWQDASVEPPMQRAYVSLAERGELTGRASISLRWDGQRGQEQVEELLERRGAWPNLRAGTVKIFLDGVIENFSAYMLEPYLDADGSPTDNRGISMVDPDRLPGYVSRLHREGFQVHFHAIGDGAVRLALDAVEAAVDDHGPRDLRHHVAHIQVVHPDDVPRFARLGVTPNAQALWACHEPQMDELTIPFLGPDRAARQYPFASLDRAGARLAMGSDWGVSSADPLAQIEVATTRVSLEQRDADPLLPEERLDPETALTAFTAGSAYLNHLDRETGTIEPGKLADLAVLDRDVLAAGAGRVGDARVMLTMVGGRVVHGATHTPSGPGIG
jgi:predicted amidohydrolase YtcJ